MESDPGLVARIYEFGQALLPYWWLLVTGVLLVIEPFVETFLSQPKWLEKRWPKDQRRKQFRWAAVAALLVASFLAFDDVNTRARQQHKADQSALNTALGERDEARRQRDAHVSPLQQSTIDRLSGDLITARGQIDSQKAQIENQAAEIEKLKPKPARHLRDIDKQNLVRIFTPLKDEFPTLQISAPEGEPQSYAREFSDEFNAIGIKVPRVGLVFALTDASTGIEIAYKDEKNIPKKAQDFAVAMMQAGFVVMGTKLDTLGEDEFWMIIGRE